MCFCLQGQVIPGYHHRAGTAQSHVLRLPVWWSELGERQETLILCVHRCFYQINAYSNMLSNSIISLQLHKNICNWSSKLLLSLYHIGVPHLLSLPLCWTGPLSISLWCCCHSGTWDGPQFWYESRHCGLLPGKSRRWRLYHGCCYGVQKLKPL